MGTSQQRSFRFLLAAKLAPEVGIAPTSPPLQGGANLPQLPGVLAHGHDLRTAMICARPRLVVPHGNAPWSSGYQPGALLLS
jgi:hypothetical protein